MEKPLRCLIVDDEPPAREILRRYVEDLPMLELAGESSNAIQTLSFLQQHSVDLVFLDIRMPQLNGNELVKILKNPPRIIFTTAYPEYAVEGFDLDAVDYLLKPIKFERFLKAVNKVIQTGTAVEKELVTADLKNESFVYFRSDRKMVKVMLQDILFIESMKDYIKVVTTGATIVTKQSMTSVEAMLPESRFLRTHRSFLVSMEKIHSFTSDLIEIGKYQVPIGKIYRQVVLKTLS